MGWSIGFIDGRDVGYGVPCLCEYPKCTEVIDRGLGYVCGGGVGGGDDGCGLFFCGEHLFYTSGKDDNGDEVNSPQLCEPCAANFEMGSDNWKDFKPPFDKKEDIAYWVWWKLRDDSWAKWREENKEEVEHLKNKYAGSKYEKTPLEDYVTEEI